MVAVILAKVHKWRRQRISLVFPLHRWKISLEYEPNQSFLMLVRWCGQGAPGLPRSPLT